MQQHVSLILYILLFTNLITKIKTSKLIEPDDEEYIPDYAYQSNNEELSIQKYEDFYSCSNHLIQCGIVKKIQYSSCSFNSQPCLIDINLNSACVRCEICLSIVDQINQTLFFIHDEINPMIHLDENQVEALFNIICNYSFTNYGLREIHDNRAISDRIPEGNVITTTADGKWSEHLKKRCYDIMHEMDLIKLYNHWKLWWDDEKVEGKMTEILCRDENTLLRDCRSITQTNRHTLSSIDNKQLKKKIYELF